MRKLVFVTIAVLAIISYSNIVKAQETAEVSIPPESQTLEVQGQARSEEIQSISSVSEEKRAESDEIILVDDSLPEGSTIRGTWNWDSALKYSGERSHTEPAAKEIAQHSYKSSPVEIPKNSVIEQYVYLDPNEIPKGIMLKFSVEDGVNDGDIGVYWEGEEEVFIYNNDEPMLYYGVLPNAGKWEKLEVYSEDLGLEGVKLIGVSFVTYNGVANWDLTRIRPIREGEGYSQGE